MHIILRNLSYSSHFEVFPAVSMYAFSTHYVDNCMLEINFWDTMCSTVLRDKGILISEFDLFSLKYCIYK